MEPSKRTIWVLAAKAFQIGWDIASGLLLGVLFGMFLDRLFHTRALFLVILSLWGIGHGFKVMIHIGEDHDKE